MKNVRHSDILVQTLELDVGKGVDWISLLPQLAYIWPGIKRELNDSGCVSRLELIRMSILSLPVNLLKEIEETEMIGASATSSAETVTICQLQAMVKVVICHHIWAMKDSDGSLDPPLLGFCSAQLWTISCRTLIKKSVFYGRWWAGTGRWWAMEALIPSELGL